MFLAPNGGTPAIRREFISISVKSWNKTTNVTDTHVDRE